MTATNVTNRIRVREFWPVIVWNGLDTNLNSADTGTPNTTLVDGHKTQMVLMAANGDKISGYRRVPFFVDPTQPMGFRINWLTGASVSTDSTSWVILVDFIAENGSYPNNASGVLDTLIPTDTLDANTAFLNKWTNRGIKNKNFLTRAQVENGAMMSFSIEMDSSSGIDLATEKIWISGIEIDYVRHDYVGTPDAIDEPLSGIPT